MSMIHSRHLVSATATSALGLLVLAPVEAVELEEGEQGATIHTSTYVAAISTSGGAVLASLKDRQAGREMPITRAGLTITAERDRPEWSDAWCPASR